MNTEFITKAPTTFYNRITANKHTSIAAMIVVGGEVVSALTKIWAPEYSDKMDATLKVVQRGAIAYGLFLAGDSQPSQPNPPDKPAQP